MDTTKWTPAPDVMVRVLDGEAVLLDLASGTYFALNPTGTLVWELLSQGKTYEEIRAALMTTYEVGASIVDADLKLLWDDLTARKLIVLRAVAT